MSRGFKNGSMILETHKGAGQKMSNGTIKPSRTLTSNMERYN
jgi:hypothetical protein